jgi:hypothetical protein
MKKKDKRKIYCVRYSSVDDLYYVVQGGKLTFNEATSIADNLNKSHRLNKKQYPASPEPEHGN